MEFDITLSARSNDEGGILASFATQLEELGGESTLLEETTPYRVDSGGKIYFEARRKYHVILV